MICIPATAIGINLPNSNWIRNEHGSKSVSIGNITDAYAKAAHGNGFNEEFVYSQTERELMDKLRRSDRKPAYRSARMFGTWLGQIATGSRPGRAKGLWIYD